MDLVEKETGMTASGFREVLGHRTVDLASHWQAEESLAVWQCMERTGDTEAGWCYHEFPKDVSVCPWDSRQHGFNEDLEKQRGISSLVDNLHDARRCDLQRPLPEAHYACATGQGL